jgi:hypothetical protein
VLRRGTRKCVPGIGFKCGLHWEIAGVTGNRSRGTGGGGDGCRRQPAASGGLGLTARLRGREKAEGKGKTTGEHPYPMAERLRRLAEEKRQRSGGATGS